MVYVGVFVDVVYRELGGELGESPFKMGVQLTPLYGPKEEQDCTDDE